jgi:hypothetical protein
MADDPADEPPEFLGVILCPRCDGDIVLVPGQEVVCEWCRLSATLV